MDETIVVVVFLPFFFLFLFLFLFNFEIKFIRLLSHRCSFKFVVSPSQIIIHLGLRNFAFETNTLWIRSSVIHNERKGFKILLFTPNRPQKILWWNSSISVCIARISDIVQYNLACNGDSCLYSNAELFISFVYHIWMNCMDSRTEHGLKFLPYIPNDNCSVFSHSSRM